MKKIVLACLILSGVVAAAPSVRLHNPASAQSKKSASSVFSADSDTDNQGLGLGLSLKHVDGSKASPTGSVKALQIFPINTVTGGLTYNFS